MISGDQESTLAGDPDHPATWARTPTWLLVPANGPLPSPPVVSRPQLLPVEGLSWEDFERLCLRLLQVEQEVVHVEARRDPTRSAPVTKMYGSRGQAQEGIDVYARDPLHLGHESAARRYVCLQARRIKTVNAAFLRKGVTDFNDGKWAEVSRKFIYATSFSGVNTQFSDTVESLATTLASSSTEFEIWDQEEISTRLRDCPELVDDFFGRTWVEEFCGREAAQSLSSRLDAGQVTELRQELAKIYAAKFAVADSGLLALRLTTQKPLPLHERFVSPDLIVTSPHSTATAGVTEVQPSTPMDLHEIPSEAFVHRVRGDEADWFRPRSRVTEEPQQRLRPQERIHADNWLGSEPRQVIIGEPGVGKSTLLRYLVLDLLAPEPAWNSVAHRWGNRLPVWLPFHFFTQRIAGQTGKSASIGAALQAWLEQHDAAHVWPLVEKALNDERLLLVVDGLDEWVSDEAGGHAAAALEVFSATHAAAVIVSTRPYGLTRLALGGGWAYAHIARLSLLQRQALALRYFHAATSPDDSHMPEGAVLKSSESFISEIEHSADLRAISGIPLFFVLLIGLRISNCAKLPDRRFDVYDRVVQVLIAEHPARRRIAASVTAPRPGLQERQLRSVLAEVAFLSQERGELSAIQMTNLRKDLVWALKNPEYLALDSATAAAEADRLLDVVEGELGLLVRQGPAELGFLHRVVQEQLAAEHVAARFSPENQQALFSAHVGDARWREVLLGIMWRMSRPSELRELVRVIREHTDETAGGLRAREMLAEVAFGSYNLPGPSVRDLVSDIVEIIETHPYLPHRARLLTSMVAGLDNVATRATVTECFGKWSIMVEAPSPRLMWRLAHLVSVPVLSSRVASIFLRAIQHPDRQTAYQAATAIAVRYRHSRHDGSSEPLREGLLRILQNPSFGHSAAAGLAALAFLWRDDERVESALEAARSSRYEGLKLVALADVLGVLEAGLLNASKPSGTQKTEWVISPEEREWLFIQIERRYAGSTHAGLMFAVVCEAFRNDQEALRHFLSRMESGLGFELEFTWLIVIKLFSSDERVATLVEKHLSDEDNRLSLLFHMEFSSEGLLSDAYAQGMPHSEKIAEAIEKRLTTSDTEHWSREFRELSAINRGPPMKRALIHAVKRPSYPHWAAAALAEYFCEDSEVLAVLEELLLSEPGQASRIAGVASELLGTKRARARLMEILRAPMPPGGVRQDIVASELISACADTAQAEREAIATEAIELISRNKGLYQKDALTNLALSFYPFQAAKAVLDKMRAEDEKNLEVFLIAYRHEPEALAPYLDAVENLMRGLPSSLRGFICRLLADREAAPEVVMKATRQWDSEHAEANKSIASLAYHRALIAGYNAGFVSDSQIAEARQRLAEVACVYGVDHEARRRAAWVGMCVLDDWSMLADRKETIGDSNPVCISLADPLHGPDLVLLEQIALRWDHLQDHFGAGLIERLSGKRGRDGSGEVWNSLVFVASHNERLASQIRNAILEDSSILKKEGVFAWFASDASVNREALIDLIAIRLEARNHLRNTAAYLARQPDRIGIDPQQLQKRIEQRASDWAAIWGNPALEALAVLSPNHLLVQRAWHDIRILLDRRKTGVKDTHGGPHPRTYFAVAYASVDSQEVPRLIEHDLAWMDRVGETIFDGDFSFHVVNRMRRDPAALESVRTAASGSDTAYDVAVVMSSLLGASGGVDESLEAGLGRLLQRAQGMVLSPIVSDRVMGATVPARISLLSVADVGFERIF